MKHIILLSGIKMALSDDKEIYLRLCGWQLFDFTPFAPNSRPPGKYWFSRKFGLHSFSTEIAYELQMDKLTLHQALAKWRGREF
jgi:hypothetical protein